MATEAEKERAVQRAVLQWRHLNPYEWLVAKRAPTNEEIAQASGGELVVIGGYLGMVERLPVA